MSRSFSFWVALFMVATSLSAQNKDSEATFTEGLVRYNIEVEGVSDELAGFMKGSTLSVFLKNDWSKMELAILAGIAKMQLISNANQKDNTLLMDIPTVSEKTAVSMEGGLKNVFSPLTNARPEKYVMQPFKNKTKRIAGYRCHKVEIATSNGKPIIVYVTNKIKMPVGIDFPMLWFDQLEGFPLFVEMEIEGTILRFTAKEVAERSLMDSFFEIPSDYNLQPLDEFKDDISEKLGLGKSSNKFGL